MNFIILFQILLMISSIDYTVSEEDFRCENISEKLNCQINSNCKWSVWNPSRCFNRCPQLSQENCPKHFNCYFDQRESKCVSGSCAQAENEEKCKGNNACTWLDGKCKDESCLVLQATQAYTCGLDYCVWFQQRSLCYDKQCSDYGDFDHCIELSFCKWDQYKCVDQ